MVVQVIQQLGRAVERVERAAADAAQRVRELYGGGDDAAPEHALEPHEARVRERDAEEQEHVARAAGHDVAREAREHGVVRRGAAHLRLRALRAAVEPEEDGARAERGAQGQGGGGDVRPGLRAGDEGRIGGGRERGRVLLEEEVVLVRGRADAAEDGRAHEAVLVRAESVDDAAAHVREGRGGKEMGAHSWSSQICRVGMAAAASRKGLVVNQLT